MTTQTYHKRQHDSEKYGRQLKEDAVIKGSRLCRNLLSSKLMRNCAEKVPYWYHHDYGTIVGLAPEGTPVGRLLCVTTKACLHLFAWSAHRCNVSPMWLRTTPHPYTLLLILGWCYVKANLNCDAVASLAVEVVKFIFTSNSRRHWPSKTNICPDKKRKGRAEKVRKKTDIETANSRAFLTLRVAPDS